MSLQERDTKSSESVDEETRQRHPMKKDASREEQSLSEPPSGERSSRAVPSCKEEVQDKVKLQMVSKPPPSLALDSAGSEDGVLRRPYTNSSEDGRDGSPDRNDSDSTSAYEDASADTPEQDRIFPGDADAPLPDDSATNNCGELHDSKTSDHCIVS